MCWVQKASCERCVLLSDGDISVAQCSALLWSGSETMCYIQQSTVIRSAFAQFCSYEHNTTAFFVINSNNGNDCCTERSGNLQAAVDSFSFQQRDLVTHRFFLL